MSKTSSNTRFPLRATLFGLATTLSLTAFASVSQAYTSEQRIACTPDAFRLCSSEIPNIPGITACMRRHRADLSPACKAVFGK